MYPCNARKGTEYASGPFLFSATKAFGDERILRVDHVRRICRLPLRFSTPPLVLPDGQITHGLGPARRTKIFLFLIPPNQIYKSHHPVPSRGALAIVTNVGRGAVDATSRRRTLLLRTVKSCGPDAPVLASSRVRGENFLQMMVARKPVTRANSYKP
jgi:hypothetical protein